MSAPDTRHGRDGGGRRQYVTGYVLSLVLTAIAFMLVAFHVLPVPLLLVLLMALAALQVLVQLFLFMHVTEGDGSRVKGLAIGLGLFFTLAIALGSIWIMTFNSQVQ
ncbi:cytochrome C oxidase subunit IV family protein [Alicyclobacillus mali]|uniref:Cytochrome C oxidase subunit IV family protein n=2 Tax=Alicyclobacillus mali (ex Roth et al. 2021) TaxID=1123961 RepID=A0ABS0F742_9BACL|nr:cytochrome C oxidase subunit IV family protein [Alicyclobacillus mali (ex Roth et al. 2021)]MCL6489163.1 cytochrome C oxidase subunit IV family protein [Alicyclobacillus mali (ex Roth et al. 2021)]